MKTLVQREVFPNQPSDPNTSRQTRKQDTKKTRKSCLRISSIQLFAERDSVSNDVNTERRIDRKAGLGETRATPGDLHYCLYNFLAATQIRFNTTFLRSYVIACTYHPIRTQHLVLLPGGTAPCAVFIDAKNATGVALETPPLGSRP